MKKLVLALVLALVAAAAPADNLVTVSGIVQSVGAYDYTEGMERVTPITIALTEQPSGGTLTLYCVGWYESLRCHRRLHQMDALIFGGHLVPELRLVSGQVCSPAIVVDSWRPYF